jgi:hypothetical protein
MGKPGTRVAVAATRHSARRHSAGNINPMADPDPQSDSLKRLRQWRTRPEPDLGMGFLKKLVKNQIEKPYKQLALIVEAWQSLVPAELEPHTRLEGLTRGTLRVVVDSSPRLYQLDRLLRGGLEQNLIMANRGQAFRKIQLRVGELEAPPPQRDSDAGDPNEGT